MNFMTMRGRRIKSVREEHGLQRANAALADGSWLSGKEVSLADIGYAPYLTRLGSPAFTISWDKCPHVSEWYDRLSKRRPLPMPT